MECKSESDSCNERGDEANRAPASRASLNDCDTF